MDAEFKSRKQVNYDQMNGLLEFLQEHPDLAKGLTRGRRGKIHSVKLWNLCAKKLNPIKDGATKDGKGWSKYWCDWKYRVRRKALELKAARDNNKPPPEGIVPLSHMEECIIGLIGENAVEGIIIKSDPLAGLDSEEEENDNNRNNDDTASVAEACCLGNLASRPTPSKRRKRRHSSRELSDLGDDGEPSSPPGRKPRVAKRRGDGDDSDHDDEALEFLRLERENLENSKRIHQSLQAMTSEITRLADVMSHIRDILMNSNRISL